MPGELYEVLGVSPTASAEDIKRAYRQLALKLHPDKTASDPASVERFKAVGEAYSVLADPDRRRKYDVFGTTDVPDPEDAAGAGAPGFMDLADLLGSLFAGVRGHQQQPRPPMRAEVPVTLRDVWEGATKRVELDVPEACAICSSQKDADTTMNCIACDGRGATTAQIGPFIAHAVCPSCGGRGSMPKGMAAIARCAACRGAGVAQCRRAFDVRVPRGITDGHVHVLRGRGGYDPLSGESADLEMVFRYTGLPSGVVFADGGRTVEVAVDVTLQELLCGFSRTVALWQDFRVVSTGYYSPDEPKRFVGRGLPCGPGQGGVNGDILVRTRVSFPPTRALAKYSHVFRKALRIGGGLPSSTIEATSSFVDRPDEATLLLSDDDAQGRPSSERHHLL